MNEMKVERLNYYPLALDQISDKSCALCFEDPKKNEEWVAHEINGNSHPLHRECAEKALKDRITCITCESPLHSGIINHDKWMLAKQIIETAGHTIIPIEALQDLFNKILVKIKKFPGIICDDLKKQRVWEVVSKNRLETLQAMLIHEFCIEILDNICAKDLAVMLEEHKSLGMVSSQNRYTLAVKFFVYEHFIIDAVTNKTQTMYNDLVVEIVHAIMKE